MYLVYVQFNDQYDGKTGYVGSWYADCWPSVYSLDEFKYIQKFPSRNAAKAFGDRLAAHFSSLMYWEIVEI